MARADGWELHLFHVPKRSTTTCSSPTTAGYGSAVKFVAQAMRATTEDNRSLRASRTT